MYDNRTDKTVPCYDWHAVLTLLLSCFNFCCWGSLALLVSGARGEQEKQGQMLHLVEELPGSSVFFCMKKNS